LYIQLINISKMKKKLFFMLLSVGAFFTHGQNVFLTENFDYTAGTTLLSNGWNQHSGGGNNPITVTSSGLSWSATHYFGNGIGNAAAVNNDGNDENRTLNTYVNSGDVYISFLAKVSGVVTSTSGSFFLHSGAYSNTTTPVFTTINTQFRARTFTAPGSTNAKFRFGLSFNLSSITNTVGTDATTDLDTGQTYLVVVKYSFYPGANNDSVSLYVFADGDNINTEPAIPAIGPLGGGSAADASFLQYVALRQYNANQNITVDGIIVQDSWHLTTTWYLDADNDGWYVQMQNSTTSPGVGWTNILPSGGFGDCDDTDNTVWQVSTSLTTIATCNSYLWNVSGQTYSMSGTYTQTSNCNTDTLILTITPQVGSTTMQTACGSYLWSVTNQAYLSSGTYIEQNSCGADTLILTITPITGGTMVASACDSYTWAADGMTYTMSGQYYFTAGCNTDTLDLTITPTTGSTTTIVTCNSYLWNVSGQTYSISGTYTQTSNCNTDTLILTITPQVGSTTMQTACGIYLWSVTNQAYMSSGTYIEQNSCGADTLILTITPITGGTSVASACDSYMWAADGMTYTLSGQYYFTAGCNTDTLDLTINQSTSNTTTLSANGSYTWPVNGITYTQSGTYIFTTTNSAGCPNTETLNLTITIGGVCPATVTITPSGLNALWAAQGANDPYTFYYGVVDAKRLNAQVSGGVGPFTYSWSNSGANFLLPRTYYPSNSIDLFRPLASTTVTVTVTDLGTGCIYTSSVFIARNESYFCYVQGNTWYIQMCQNSQTVCVPWNIGRDYLRSNTATLGACQTLKEAKIYTEPALEIYPNPNRGVFNIAITNGTDGALEIFDLSGKRISIETLTANAGAIEHTFDLRHLPQGMYFVQYSAGHVVLTKKVVIQD